MAANVAIYAIAVTQCVDFCIDTGLWKVAVVTGVSEPQNTDEGEGQGAGEESNKQEKPTAEDESQDNWVDAQAEQQPLKPKDKSEENTNNNAKSLNENEEQVEETPNEVPFPPTCRLVMVLYGDHGKTQPLVLGNSESVSEIKFQPGIADKFIVSHVC